MEDREGRKLSMLFRLESLPLLAGGTGGGCIVTMLCRLIEVEELREGGAGGLSAEDRRLDVFVGSCPGSSAVGVKSVDGLL